MAGDWIKWTKGLPNKPEVVRLAGMLSTSRAEIVVRLMTFWEWCDDNIPEDHISEDGKAFVTLSPNRGDNVTFLDTLVGTPGFAESLASVHWIHFRDGRIELPNFGRHNGETAKSRARNARNQQRKRALSKEPLKDAGPSNPKAQASPNVSPSRGDKTVTREEERREEETSYKVSKEEDSCPKTAKRLSPKPDVNLADPVIFEYPTDGKTKSWALRETQLNRLQELFPNVDVTACCRMALAWCENHPAKRKTANGMMHFLHNWLSKEQNDATKHQQWREGRAAAPGHSQATSAARYRSGDLLAQLDEQLSPGSPPGSSASKVG